MVGRVGTLIETSGRDRGRVSAVSRAGGCDGGGQHAARPPLAAKSLMNNPFAAATTTTGKLEQL